jgi:PAS domain S-box-containing protein
MDRSTIQTYSRNRLFDKKIIDAIEDTFLVFDPETRKVKQWNKAFSKISGFTDKEIASLIAPDSYYSKEDLKKTEIAIKKSKEKQTKLKMSLITSDGKKIPFEYVEVQIKDPSGKLLKCLIGRDLRERKKIQKAIQAEEKKYRTLIENASQSIAVVMDEKIMYANSKSEEVIGYPLKDLIGLPFLELVHPDDLERIKKRYKKRIKGEELSRFVQFRMISKKGKVKWFETNGVLIPWGKKTGVMYFTTDITERKKAEKELEESMLMLNLILSSLDEGLDIVSTNYVIEFQNKYLKDRFGDAVGKKCYKSYMNLDEPCVDCSMRNALEQNKIVVTEKVVDDGRVFEVIAIPFKHFQGKGNVLEVVRDITVRNKTQQQLKKHHEDLEKLVHERTTELQTKQKKLTKTNEELSETKKDIETILSTLKEVEERISTIIENSSKENQP